MNARRVSAMYFSATGTTKRIVLAVAGRIARAWGEELRLEDFTLPQGREKPRCFEEGDLVVFGVPVYAGRVPNVLLSYIRSLTGGCALAVPGVCYGNVPNDRNGQPVNILKDKPKVGEGCTNCGLCVLLCPMGSIVPGNVGEYRGICIKCGACVKGCPADARYYDSYNYLYHKEELELGFTRRAEPELFF